MQSFRVLRIKPYIIIPMINLLTNKWINLLIAKDWSFYLNRNNMAANLYVNGGGEGVNIIKRTIIFLGCQCQLLNEFSIPDRLRISRALCRRELPRRSRLQQGYISGRAWPAAQVLNNFTCDPSFLDESLMGGGGASLHGVREAEF